jgi:hypothetical protein
VYKLAVGPNAGRKALTLYTVPPVEDEPASGLVASVGGFSLHAGTVCEPWQRSRLERLCRYITRPPIATKRLSVDAQGRVVYRYKRPFRDGRAYRLAQGTSSAAQKPYPSLSGADARCAGAVGFYGQAGGPSAG